MADVIVPDGGEGEKHNKRNLSRASAPHGQNSVLWPILSAAITAPVNNPTVQATAQSVQFILVMFCDLQFAFRSYAFLLGASSSF